jgi:hypothetical protein
MAEHDREEQPPTAQVPEDNGQGDPDAEHHAREPEQNNRPFILYLGMVLEAKYRDLLQGAYDDAVHFTDDEGVERILEPHLRFETKNWGRVESDYFRLNVFIRWLLEEKKKFSDGTASVRDWLQQTRTARAKRKVDKQKEEFEAFKKKIRRSAANASEEDLLSDFLEDKERIKIKSVNADDEEICSDDEEICSLKKLQDDAAEQEGIRVFRLHRLKKKEEELGFLVVFTAKKAVEELQKIWDQEEDKEDQKKLFDNLFLRVKIPGKKNQEDHCINTREKLQDFANKWQEKLKEPHGSKRRLM